MHNVAVQQVGPHNRLNSSKNVKLCDVVSAIVKAVNTYIDVDCYNGELLYSTAN